MTDQPRTAAGQDMLEWVDDPFFHDEAQTRILAIEAEAAAPALDRDKIEHVARYLRRRYNLRQSIPELVMGLDNALVSADEEGGT